MSESAEDCSDSILEALAAQGALQPISGRKRMAVGEGLNKIWMCPSSEMTTALFSSRPKEVKNWIQAASLNVMDKLSTDKRLDPDQVAQYLQDYSRSDLKSRDKDLSESEGDYSADYSSSVISSVEGEAEEESASSEESLTDEKMVRVEESLKTMYRQKLALGEQMLMSYSLGTLGDRLYALIKDIRMEEQRKIDQELKPILDFMDRYLVAVNRENGFKLKKKYKLQRRQFIARMVNTAEEGFSCRCIQIEKELKEKYLFRISVIKNKHTIEHKEKLEVELSKLVGKMKEDKNELIEKHESNMNSIKEKFSNKYRELETLEQNRVDAEVNRIKQIMDDIEEANKQDAQDPNEKCSEVSGWLCILQQLLSDMQEFIRKYINGQADLKLLLKKMIHQRTIIQPTTVEHKDRVKLISKAEDLVSIHTQGLSFESVPCIPGRDDKLHRALLEEAEAILNDILHDLTRDNLETDKLVPEYEVYRSPTIDELNGTLPRHFASDEDRSYYSSRSNVTPSDFVDV